MTNLASGKAGSKTTHLWVSTCPEYFGLIDYDYIQLVKGLPCSVILGPTDLNTGATGSARFMETIRGDALRDPVATLEMTTKYHSTVMAFKYLRRLFFGQEIHFVGDLDRVTTWPEIDANCYKFWDEQLERGSMIHVPVVAK